MAKIIFHSEANDEEIGVIEMHAGRLNIRVLDKLLAEKGLSDEELKEFERFREEFWERKKGEYGL